jgi:hypothetical protein
MVVGPVAIGPLTKSNVNANVDPEKRPARSPVTTRNIFMAIPPSGL